MNKNKNHSTLWHWYKASPFKTTASVSKVVPGRGRGWQRSLPKHYSYNSSEPPLGWIVCRDQRNALDDVLKTEGAVAGESFAFAATTQVLSVWPFRIHMACCSWTCTARLLAALKQETMSISLIELLKRKH